MAKPRLLVTTSTYPRWPGDPGPAFVHELARRLAERFEVRVLAPHSPGAATYEHMDGVEIRRFRYAPAALETLAYDGGILQNLRMHPLRALLLPGFVLAQWCAVTASLWRWRPAAVHAHWVLPQGLLARWALLPFRVRPPLLVTLHGSDLYRLTGGFAARLRRWVFAGAAQVTVVSDAMRQSLLEAGLSAAAVQVAPMGVDLQSRFVPSVDSVRDPARILFVGRLVEGKGLGSLVRALPAIRAAIPEARLDLIGDGPLRAGLEQQVEALGLAAHVRFLGPCPQEVLPEHYRRVAVLAAPFDRAEGFGLVLVEAMGCACPIVTTPWTPLASFIGDDGRVVAADDVAALATALIATLSAPEEATRRAQALASRASQAFGWAAASERYAAILSTLTETRA